MFSVDALKDATYHLFRGGIGEDYGYDDEDVEAMMDCIDFHALLQAVRHKMGTAYAYITQGNQPKSFNYRGPELFGQRAICLSASMQSSTAEVVVTNRYEELWLLEDMTFAPVVCITVACGKEYVTEYRVVKEGDPWQNGMMPDLEELTYTLRDMCDPCYECEIPVYEL